MREITILLVGVGGYGGLIAEEAIKNAETHQAKIVGVVEPFIENSPVKELIKEKNIPFFRDLGEFYAKHKADLAILSTPIHLHASQCVFCMANGSDVLCEKPIAPTLDDAKSMADAAKTYHKHLNIGFQLSYAPGVLKLKEDILAGKFGAPVSMATVTCWPRNSAYFARPWAAKASLNGAWVLDSIAMNACAHYLHICFFLLGQTMDAAARPKTVRAALYRANKIETYDTACFDIKTNENIPITFMATHASEENINPEMRFVFENAVIKMNENGGEQSIIAVMRDGSVIPYGATYDRRFDKIWYACDVTRGEKAPVCTVDTALSHLMIVNAVSEFVPVRTFDRVETVNDVKVVPGLSRRLINAFQENRLPECLIFSKEISLENYRTFGGLQ